ncbi:hypothetical protein BCV70DRAFT_161241 [Testicularia cyperi]|uniref:Uncharacterized protein n=1 Tax=Testicularia cyperi TaxID=1882483 RepID=A0A317XQT6_9BASI|nr:hypothetical protein BCV70DRAFT_161241 [Testicularia cyperi]
MPPRRSSRTSSATAPAVKSASREPIIIELSSDTDEDAVPLIKMVPETPSPRPLRRASRSAARVSRSFSTSGVSTPATGSTSRTTSTHTSGSHTPATSVDGGDADDADNDAKSGVDIVIDIPFVESSVDTSVRVTRPSRSASLRSRQSLEQSSVHPRHLPSKTRKRKLSALVASDFKPLLPPTRSTTAAATSKRPKREQMSEDETEDLPLAIVVGMEANASGRQGTAKGKGKVNRDPDSTDEEEPLLLQSGRRRTQPARGSASLTPVKAKAQRTDLAVLLDSDIDDEDEGSSDLTDEDDVEFKPVKAVNSRGRKNLNSPAELGRQRRAYIGRANTDPDETDVDEDSVAATAGPSSAAGAHHNPNAEEQQYETAKQRAARLRREDRLARLKKVDTRTQYDKNAEKLNKHHPELKDVWGGLKKNVAVIKPQEAEQPKGLNIKLLPFQREGLYWMTRQEQGTWKGGMLADEMGMGKTIQMISLMLSDRKKPCLVVAPTVAIMQWRNEIEKYTEPKLSVILWHGASRTQDLKTLKSADVVLTSYAVLESSYRKQEQGFRRKNELIKERSAMHAVHWRRIILDEAHNIKERSTNTAKGAFALKGDFRWCLSGTPLQNRVGELYSMIRFLGGDPFAYYFCKKCPCKSLHWSFSDKRNCDSCGHTPMHHTCFWNNEILKPIQRNGIEQGEGRDAFGRLRLLLERMMLRRTKLERADDMGLPPRTIEVRRDLFNEEEEDLYTSLYTDTTRRFSTYLDQGTVLNNYSNIFTLLTRMRQLANHPDLVLRSKTGVASKLLGDDQSEIHVCRLCTDEAEDAIMSRCRHIFCRECVRQYLDTEIAPGMVPDCPHCHATLSIDLEAEALEPPQSTVRMNDNGRQGILARLDMDKWRSSTKIEALVEELTQLRTEDKTIKSLVFSQFVNFLDLIAFRLQRAGFQICRLEGNMSPEARNRTIKHFMENPNVTVFLVSLKAGGVALNLTEASRVYLMDPWWNPSVEVQAMDRIHRLGQHRPIIVKRMVIENSIESRIIELQNKKSAMIEAAIGKDDAAMGRLSVSDLRFLFTL